MIFSPQSKDNYVRELPDGRLVGFGAFGHLESTAAWNLFYLSEPLVDVAASWPKQKTESMPRFSNLIYPCYLACETDKLLSEALETLTPAEFLEAFKKMNYRAMEPFKLLGEQWVAIMESKVHKPRGILMQEGNVLSVNFGKSVFNLPKGISSAIIMPMSYTRH